MPILNWLDRDKHVKQAEAVPYRLLEADDANSAGDTTSQNMVIQGDNLDAVKALLPYYAGLVKCIFIDPPYNTKSAFEHYDDKLVICSYPKAVHVRSYIRYKNGHFEFICEHCRSFPGTCCQRSLF